MVLTMISCICLSLITILESAPNCQYAYAIDTKWDDYNAANTLDFCDAEIGPDGKYLSFKWLCNEKGNSIIEQIWFNTSDVSCNDKPDITFKNTTGYSSFNCSLPKCTVNDPLMYIGTSKNCTNEYLSLGWYNTNDCIDLQNGTYFMFTCSLSPPAMIYNSYNDSNCVNNKQQTAIYYNGCTHGIIGDWKVEVFNCTNPVTLDPPNFHKVLTNT
eukprot:455019_1